MSQARNFLEYIKTHPEDRNRPGVWKRFKVVNVIYVWNPQGFYKAHAFDFEDDSTLENKIVYD